MTTLKLNYFLRILLSTYLHQQQKNEDSNLSEDLALILKVGFKLILFYFLKILIY